ncbi:heme-degrading domain-containing protein [Pseudomonas wadenswilerensis]
MDLKNELAMLIRQEQALQFDRFDEHSAWQLGSLLYQRATAENWPLLIDIRRFDRPLFLAARPGTSADNHEWVRRKNNTVRRFLCSSYRMAHQLRLEGSRDDLPVAEYACVGGGFPLIVRGAGVIGSVTVSGLPDRHDHQVVVDGLCAVLEQCAETLSLPPNVS